MKNKKNVHFIGIGGIGMSAIARVLLGMGYGVSGSDLEPSDITRRLESLGGRIYKGHKRSNVLKGTDAVVYSSSISCDNPEIKEARKREISVLHRAEMLAEIFNRKKGIAVTGTHGKTTTASLVSVMLADSGFDPTVLIGGEVMRFEGNASLGNGAHVVAEADESDSSFLRLKPLHAVITNLEMEHVDHYGSLGDAKRAYRSFIDNLKPGGTIFYNFDDKNLREVIKGFNGKSLSFGFSGKADIYPEEIKMDGFNTAFKCFYKNKILGEVRLRIPGAHNVLNAMAAIGLGMSLGIDFKNIAIAIENFEGAKRRFQLRASWGSGMLIDDYAHHPTEIRAVLNACRNWKGRRVRAIFQPHRYSRTKFLAEDFGKCFGGADELILTDIYAASEKPIKGVSVKTIYDKVAENGFENVKIMKKRDIVQYVMKSKKANDIILVLGAGDIKQAADELARKINVEKFKGFIKGAVMFGERLASRTSFRIGGPADIWAEPKDVIDLRNILKLAKKERIRTFVIGNGSNILASDAGFRGMMIHLGALKFRRMSINGARVRIGTGFSLQKLVRICCARGLGGLESLVGIPGTVGGAIYMNAGGWTNPIFKNIGNIVESLKAMDSEGRIRNLKKSDIKFGYRRTNLDSYIILEAVLKLERADRSHLVSSRSQFLKMKMEKQALEFPSAGCVFKNPDSSQFTCGQMIDTLGLKGRRVGMAEVSEKHANFIVNRSGATCKDVMALVDIIKEKVRESYMIDLELEVKVI